MHPAPKKFGNLVYSDALEALTPCQRPPQLPRYMFTGHYRPETHKKSHFRAELTYEHDYNQAKFIQVNIWIGESIAERRVDDHQEHRAADSTKWRLPPFKPVLDVPSDNLKHRNQQVASFPRCREPSWASQSESDSGKTQREESNLDDGHSGFQSFPATQLFFWGI